MTTHQTRSDLEGSVDGERGVLLRFLLKFDAIASGALGVLSLTAGPALEGLLGTPVALLAPVGVFLLTWAVALWVIASRPRIGRTAVWVVILLNVLYAVDCVVVLMAGWFPLSALGVAFVLAQAAAVALFAAAQLYALLNRG